jgi:hypothetical protein
LFCKLTKGYQVRLVEILEKLVFKRVGVELVYGDLTRPETIPLFKGITAAIDASTSRANELEFFKSVDLVNI